MESAFIVMMPLGAFFMVGFIAWVIGRTKQERYRTESMREVHTKMLDRLGSSDEFLRFVQSDEGRKYLSSIASPTRAAANPASRIIATTNTGIIIVMVSIGFGLVAAMMGFEGPDNPPLVIGALGFFLGIGFLASAFSSHRMSKSFGLMGRPDERTD